jgi:hypothetical protein
MSTIKLNFLDDELTDCRISVDVDHADIKELFEYWEDNLEEIGDSEFEVYFEWGMVDGALPIEKLGLVFLWKQIHYNCDFQIASKKGPFTICEYQVEGVIKDCKIKDYNFILVKDESDDFVDLNDNEKQLAEKYMEENCGIGEYSYGIFKKEDWGKLNIDDLKNF